ncbi:hypothetical protein N7541_002946 [Penicillium brevicompactum]|uniref:Uncharacterized protein n=1 Tax=Penicillium brevicompactum TaxID=5074 RepID=A0A9W9RL14_PENBR|nr:hypothetical protein N7541_002946 [Penicillium brevicompactum]
MPSLFTIVIQSAILKAVANTTAQVLSQRGSTKPILVDWNRVLEFAVFGVITAPLISLWQQFLDEKFPSQPQNDEKPTKRKSSSLNWPNIILKLALDQTIGLFLTNVTFIVCTTGPRLQSGQLILREINNRIWGILRAGWKIWPAMALINFIWVPWQWRVVVNSVVGFGWNILLSLL